MWYVRLVLCLVCSFLLVIDADFSTVCFYLRVSIYIYLETLLFLYHRSSCLRFGSCRSPDLKGMSLCCSRYHGGLYILDSRYVRSGDGHAGTHIFPLPASSESKSQFRLLFPELKTCLAAFSVVSSEFKMVFHI